MSVALRDCSSDLSEYMRRKISKTEHVHQSQMTRVVVRDPGSEACTNELLFEAQRDMFAQMLFRLQTNRSSCLAEMR